MVRVSTWLFRNGESARTTYETGRRILEYLDPTGQPTLRVKTAYKKSPRGFRTLTDVEDSFKGGNDRSRDGEVIGTGPNWTVVFNNMPQSTGTVTLTPNGYTTTEVTVVGGAIYTGQVVANVDPSTGFGDINASGQAQTPNGVAGYASSVSNGPDGMDSSQSTSGTTPDGGFFVNSQSDDGQGNTQQSFFTSDSQGNSTETILTNNSDGSSEQTITQTNSDGSGSSQTITSNTDGTSSSTTTTTTSDGTTSTTTATYDQQGHDTSNDTNADPGGITAEPPDPNPYDSMPDPEGGTDETPRGRFQGAADAAFTQLFGDDDAGTLTGVNPAKTPVHDTGDPAGTLQKSFEPSDEGSGSEGTSGSGLSVDISVDFRLISDYVRPDGEDFVNPRAMVQLATLLLGNQRTALAQQVVGSTR